MNPRSFSKDVGKRVAAKINREYSAAKETMGQVYTEFDSYMALMDAKRDDREYEWMSDVRLPEFVSIILTQLSIDVDQYFSTRDFTDVFVEDNSEEALKAAESSKRVINRTLNCKDLNYYQKFVRAKMLSYFRGDVVFVARWIKERGTRQTGEKEVLVPSEEFDMQGVPLLDLDTQMPALESSTEPVFEEVDIVDRFDFDVVDPRNVFYDSRFTYNLQQKDWVIIRDEKSRSELEAEAESWGFFNLDALDDVAPPEQTETGKDTYQKESQGVISGNEKYDILIRYGKDWAIVKERDEIGYPVEIEPGYDEFGKKKENAEYIETIQVCAVSAGAPVLLAYHQTPYLDAKDRPYRPVIRAICYQHPINDGGFGDGKYAVDLQHAIDDTFNLSQDRAILGTMPTFKVGKNSLDDNATLYFEPGHGMQCETPNDIEEFKVSDNTTAALQQMSVLQNKMQQLTAVFPTTMGDMPSFSSTSATAIVGADSRANQRSNYKAKTFEFTGLVPLYEMILQMTYRFASEKTLEALTGDRYEDFDPSKDYWYKPISQTIETESSKQSKIQRLTTILGYYAGIQHPDAVKVLNAILVRIAKLMGEEESAIIELALNPKDQMQQGPMASQAQAAGAPTSNQYGLPQMGSEEQARNFQQMFAGMGNAMG